MRDEVDHLSFSSRFLVPIFGIITIICLLAEAPTAQEEMGNSLAKTVGSSSVISVSGQEFERMDSFEGDTLGEIREAILKDQLMQILSRFPNRIRSEDRERIALSLMEEGEKAKIDPFLLIAIICEESGFFHDAFSPAGARGLMQLQVETAQEMARRLSMGKLSLKMLNDPVINIKLGVCYLQDLIKGYQGNYLLALTAYNLGPGAMAHLFRNHGGLSKRHVEYYRKVLATYRGYRHTVAGARLTFLQRQPS
jgi:hypothetical protein